MPVRKRWGCKMEEIEKAHADYEKRKVEIINRLVTLRDYAPLMYYQREWLNQAIGFIKEKEI